MIVGYLNDMWKYDLVNNEWEWLYGNKRVGVYLNYTHPGGVMYHSGVIDSTDRYIYVFGGNGFVNGSEGNSKIRLTKQAI